MVSPMNIAKTHIILACCALLLMNLGACRKNPNSAIPLPQFIEYTGTYMDTSDILRIGHALDTVETRKTVQWENGETGYQYSMMVFSSDAAMGKRTRTFSVLAISPDRDGEVLNLVGHSSKAKTWTILAESLASPVGKAVRMNLKPTPAPNASLTSGAEFRGFQVVD